MNNSYAIYFKDSAGEFFLEGSKKYNSPYFEIIGKDIRYLGPGNYYYVENNRVIDILTKKESDLSCYSDVETISTEKISKLKEPTTYSTRTNERSVPYANLFSKMTNFPMNWFGECGIIALSIYLSYFDTVHNDDFIPNNRQYYSYQYDLSEGRTDEEKLQPVNKTLQPLVKTTSIAFKGNASYDANSWGRVPGINYSMRDLIFDHYKETLIGIGGTGGFPMTGIEINRTFNNYMSAEAPSLLQYCYTSSGLYPFPIMNQNIVSNYVNKGLPVVLFIPDYKIEYPEGKKTGKWHDVVAYGYSGNNLICHMGWEPGTQKFSETYLSNVWIWGYFGMEYFGGHKHSQSVSMNHYTGRVKVCADGHFTY